MQEIVNPGAFYVIFIFIFIFLVNNREELNKLKDQIRNPV
jgi:hypothetical protein